MVGANEVTGFKVARNCQLGGQRACDANGELDSRDAICHFKFGVRVFLYTRILVVARVFREWFLPGGSVLYRFVFWRGLGVGSECAELLMRCGVYVRVGGG